MTSPESPLARLARLRDEARRAERLDLGLTVAEYEAYCRARAAALLARRANA